MRTDLRQRIKVVGSRAHTATSVTLDPANGFTAYGVNGMVGLSIPCRDTARGTESKVQPQTRIGLSPELVNLL